MIRQTPIITNQREIINNLNLNVTEGEYSGCSINFDLDSKNSNQYLRIYNIIIMKKITLLLVGFFLISFTSGQVFPDSLYLHLYNFKVITGELPTDSQSNEIKNIFSIDNLVDSVNTESFGIFKFYHLAYEDAIASFFIIENSNVEIYDILSFDVLIEKILDIPSFSEKSKNLCIKEILKELQSYYEIVDFRIVLQQDFGTYHYILPAMNIKNQEGIIKK